MLRRLMTGLALVLALSGVAAAQSDALLESLEPRGYVSDFAGVIGAQAPAIESILSELEQKTGAQVAVVTLPSLEGGEIADFSNRLFERWGIGRAGEDDGVLILAAIEDRRVRIEVGYGLEPVLNDAMTGRILDQAVLPSFRNGDFGGGLAGGASAVAAVIANQAGVELTGAVAVGQAPPQRRSPLGGWLQLLILLLVIPIVWRNPWLLFLLMSGGRGGGFGGRGGGFGRHGGGGFGGFGGGMSGGGGASRSW